MEVPDLVGGCCKAFPEHSAGVDPCKETDPLREEGRVETVPQVEVQVAKILEVKIHMAWSPMEEGHYPFSLLFSNVLHFSVKSRQTLMSLALRGGGLSSAWAQRQEPAD